uniref:Uncharacterized protein n=1 Tax=Physcomitrium patens TaxID=3218 RepID=A0A7I4AAT0_PHYPA
MTPFLLHLTKICRERNSLRLILRPVRQLVRSVAVLEIECMGVRVMLFICICKHKLTHNVSNDVANIQSLTPNTRVFYSGMDPHPRVLVCKSKKRAQLEQ